MVNYRRDFTSGGVYFFTVTLRDRNTNLLTTHIQHLGDAFRLAQKKANYKMLAFVVLPEHLHVMWKLPDDDFNYSRRWLYIKSSFTRSLIKAGLHLVPNKHGEYKLWQRRFWEHKIRNEIDYQRHVDYIHYNPVKHHLVAYPTQWPYSSIHRFINQGILDKNWGADLQPQDGSYGE